MTKGEYRVCAKGDPLAEDVVDQIERAAADLIDLIDGIRVPLGVAHAEQCNEVSRLIAIAQTHVEDAAMWAVKAATKPARLP